MATPQPAPSERASRRTEDPNPTSDSRASRSAVPSTWAVAMTTQDSMRTLPATLAPFAGLGERRPRLVVVDSGSRDGTVAACEAAGATVIHRAWAGHVAQKQFAIDQCAGARWVLVLDSDESPDAALLQAILDAIERDNPLVAGYSLRRALVLHDRLLPNTFQPEWRTRLVRPDQTKVAGTPPHDYLTVDGGVGRLPGILLHNSWADVDDMLRRHVGYAKVSAAGDTRGGGLLDILVRPGAAFFKQYLLRGAWRDGWRGLVAAGGAASSTLMKHLAIAERRGLAGESSSRPSDENRDRSGSTSPQ